MPVKNIKIIGTGRYLPPKVVTNDDLSRTMDTSDEWIRERTGIRARRVVEGDTATSHLAARAIENACHDAGIEPSQLDGIIVGTCSQDTLFPSTACWVQDHLQIRGMPAFDVMAGCSSFLYGLEIASNWVAGNPDKRVAVCGAEVFSKILNWDDRRTSVLFGDGAGAAIVSGGHGDSGIMASNWGSDGTLASILQVPGGGTRMPASHASVDERAHTVHMEGSKVFRHAVTAMSQGLLEALATAGVTADDVDVFIPHQANLRIMEAARERAKIPLERVFSVLDDYGNISAASIPVAISEAREAGVLKDGQVLAMTAFGTGLTWAASVMRW
ncbi:MAG: ketoacyl-ACP synthase III [Deltaproteobacteria bacterium]|nr:ketoacyl-ACP synthase III [Deltaproteobacteria bacterium]MBK8236951.1 ketoacyl-ACP synthase III [Deltaproteobacteria bacterium]MBP7289799.1 ketoacyl-ACP synthase III [Nannocystaceae bacterium]